MYRDLLKLMERYSAGDPAALPELLKRFQSGEPGAAECIVEVLQPYLGELRNRVRKRIGSALRARLSSEAIVESALRRFLGKVPKNQAILITSHESVKRQLHRLAMNILVDQIRRCLADKRDARKDKPLGEAALQAARTSASVTEPEEFLEKLYLAVRDIHKNAIDVLDLREKGLDNRAIAEQSGRSIRWVEQRVAEIRAAADRLLQED